jgi:uncharacterized protein (TIRG00374 family)
MGSGRRQVVDIERQTVVNPVNNSQPDANITNKRPSTESAALPPSLWGWHTILSLAITIAIFAFLATKLDLSRIWHEVSQSNVTLLILGALSHYATYPLRGARWQRCMTHLPATCGQGKFGLLLFFYNAVDNVVPAKLGDVYGAHLARINCGIRRSAAMGSLVFLRMVDAWIVLVLALPASWFLFSAKLPKAVFWALIGGGIIAVAATAILLTFFFLKKSLPGWLPEKIKDIVRAFQTGMWPRPSEAIPIAALTLSIWFLETLWIFFLVLGFGVTLNGKEAVFLTMIPLLASGFPLTPSGAGVVDITLFSCLRVVGIASPLAVSITVVNRFIDYWLHIGLGLLVWALREKLGIRAIRDVAGEGPHPSVTADTPASSKRELPKG